MDGSTKNQTKRVTLSKAHRDTPPGRELVELLVELSADGMISREELERLRAWLEVDRGVDFPACAFLYSVVEPIASDGVITENELDGLALAIERVLPADIRSSAMMRRKAYRAARRRDVAARSAAERDRARTARIVSQLKMRALDRADFLVMGACRSDERRSGCAGLTVGEAVTLDREPTNVHDPNAILVLTGSGGELGYVPRQDAKRMAPLLDGGAEAEAKVKKLIYTSDGNVLPVVISTLRRVGSTPSQPMTAGAQLANTEPTGVASASHPVHRGAGCSLLLVLCVGMLGAFLASHCGQ